jgi:hypothetical protein
MIKVDLSMCIFKSPNFIRFGHFLYSPQYKEFWIKNLHAYFSEFFETYNDDFDFIKTKIPLKLVAKDTFHDMPY